VRSRVFQDIAELRQHEAELKAVETRLEFYKDKSGWAQERVEQGYDDVAGLWDLGHQLNEEKAQEERLGLLISTQRHRVAWHAGDAWKQLLAYLEGKGQLPAR